MRAAFDQVENTRKIYDVFRDWVGVKPASHSDRSEVEVSTLKGDRLGYVVAMNHSDQPRDSSIVSTLPVRSYTLVNPDGPKALPLDGANTKIQLGPYEAAILESKQ